MNNKFPDQSGHAHINVLRSADFLEIEFLKNIFQEHFLSYKLFYSRLLKQKTERSFPIIQSII